MGDETRVQMVEVKKGASAMGNMVERYMIRFLGPLGRKIAAASKTGRAMALVGVVMVVVSLVFIITTNSLTYHKSSPRRGYDSISIRYDMKGYGWPFIIGAGLLIIGVMQKKK
jgi:hypothetical protein